LGRGISNFGDEEAVAFECGFKFTCKTRIRMMVEKNKELEDTLRAKIPGLSRK